MIIIIIIIITCHKLTVFKPCEICKMGRFWKQLTPNFAKSSILDVSLGFEYAFEHKIVVFCIIKFLLLNGGCNLGLY